VTRSAVAQEQIYVMQLERARALQLVMPRKTRVTNDHFPLPQNPGGKPASALHLDAGDPDRPVRIAPYGERGAMDFNRMKSRLERRD
jgi:hypothetical protein